MDSKRKFDNATQRNNLSTENAKQKETIEDLVSELEEERNASSLAANEYLQKLAEVQREARNFKRSAERKMANDNNQILMLKDELNNREKAINSLTTQVQSFKHMLMEKHQKMGEIKREARELKRSTRREMANNQQEILALKGKLNMREVTIQSLTTQVHSSKNRLVEKQQEMVAKELGIPIAFQEYWIWVQRENRTFRPHRPLTPLEETYTVGELTNDVGEYFNTSHAELKLFLGLELGQDLSPIPPPDHTKEDILLFFKLYDPHKEELRYVGRLFVKSFGKPCEILTVLNEMAGFASDEEIELFEELKFLPTIMCEKINQQASFRYSQIEDGDIICFQKKPKPGTKELVRFSDVPSYLKYLKVIQNLDIQKPIKICN